MKKLFLIFVALLTLTGCDAWLGKIDSIGSSAKVECWSGGLKIFEGRSTGKVQNSTSSDGYYFRDALDDNFKEVSGNCIITYD